MADEEYCDRSGALPGPHWSVPAELKGTGGMDPDVRSLLIRIFVQESTLRIGTLLNAWKSREFGVIATESRSLRRDAVQMGARPLSFYSAGLELAARNKREQCSTLIEDIAREFACVRREMEGYVGEMQREARERWQFSDERRGSCRHDCHAARE